MLVHLGDLHSVEEGASACALILFSLQHTCILVRGVSDLRHCSVLVNRRIQTLHMTRPNHLPLNSNTLELGNYPCDTNRCFLLLTPSPRCLSFLHGPGGFNEPRIHINDCAASRLLAQPATRPVLHLAFSSAHSDRIGFIVPAAHAMQRIS